MGRDPKTSVLNAHNQAHDAKNLFVTDGACMASSSCVTRHNLHGSDRPRLRLRCQSDEARRTLNGPTNFSGYDEPPPTLAHAPPGFAADDHKIEKIGLQLYTCAT